MPVRIAAQGVLFDMDGVLIDSIPAVDRVWRAWAREHGLDPEAVSRHAHGRPSRDTIAAFLPKAPLAEMLAEMERREIADVGGVTALPGALALLASLPPERWTIVTSCSRELARARAAAVGLRLPPRLVSACDVRQGKPHPEPYRAGAAALGLAPRDCVVLEDVDAGVAAARAAGARVLAVATHRSAAALRGDGADWVVASCAAVRAEAHPAGLELEIEPLPEG